MLFHHLIGQEAVAEAVEQVLGDLAAVVHLEAEGVPRREEGAHELARVAEGEVAHQILAFEQLRLADAAGVGVAGGGDGQHEAVGGEAVADKPALFEGKVGEGDVDEVFLQHLQKVGGVAEHDLERHVRVGAEEAGQRGVEAALVHGVDAADAQRLVVAGGGVHLADEAVLEVADALGVA